MQSKLMVFFLKHSTDISVTKLTISVKVFKYFFPMVQIGPQFIISVSSCFGTFNLLVISLQSMDLMIPLSIHLLII